MKELLSSFSVLQDSESAEQMQRPTFLQNKMWHNTFRVMLLLTQMYKIMCPSF